MTFDEFVAQKRAAEAATIRVTWRRISSLTGGGYSGIGPGRRLVFVVALADSGYHSYGYVRPDGERVPVGQVDQGPTAAKTQAEKLYHNPPDDWKE